MRMHLLARFDPRTTLFSLAMACMIGVASAEDVTINGLYGEPLIITTDVATDEPPPLCMAHESSIPGQGLHVSGSSLVVEPAAAGVHGARPVAPTVPDAIEALIENRSEDPAHSVVVLVVDDFQEVAGDSDGPESHGELVMHHLQALADDILGDGRMSSTDDTMRWTVSGDVELVVVPVDVADRASGTAGGSNLEMSTDTIEDRVTAAFHSALDSEQPVRRMVINMSWVLLPCSAIAEFHASEYDDFETYVGALADINDGLSMDDIFSAMATPWERDPLVMALESLDGAYVAPVASAGNFGLDYQMLPAEWNRVIGVSATPGPPSYSNRGGVIADGGWFTYEPASNQAAYAGTSFAAPLVSLFTAIDLMNDDPWCTDLQDPSPELHGPDTLEKAIDDCRSGSAR